LTADQVLVAQRAGIIRVTRQVSAKCLKGGSVYLITGDCDDPIDLMSIVSDESLVVRAQNGECWAYTELCRRHRVLVSSIVQRITKNSHDTEDVLQDCWMKAFVHIKTFDGRSSFSTWLTRIAINSALMILRKRRWHLEASLDDQGDADLMRPLEVAEPSDDPEEYLIRLERQLRVRRAIQGLPPSLRKVTEIRQSLDISVQELAAMTGLSISAAKSRLRRARIALREPLQRI
jgi:RNA polymerase sigma-70 factor, ECF subfamily